MTQGLKLILCAYNWVGLRVLEHVLERQDVSDVALFTHERKHPNDPDLVAEAKRLGVWVSTENVSRATLPFLPDIIASVYYYYIIKPHLIELVGGRIFNTHPSLLPRHRGSSTVTWALVEGDHTTGISYHYIDEEIDTGRLLMQASIEIEPTDTQVDLYRRCMERAADFWPAAFELVKLGFAGVPQEGVASYHRPGPPHSGEIDESWPLDRVERFIRAMINPPYPYARYCGQEVRTLDEYLAL